MRSERARTNSLSPKPLFLWIVAIPDYKVCAATVEKQSYATLLLASLTLLIVIPTLVVAVVTFVRVNSKDCPLAGATTIQLDTPVPTAPNTPEPSEGDDGHGEPTGDHAAAHWGYSGDIAPDMWGELSPDWSTCSTGRQQSPIDIVSANVKDPSAAETDINRAAFQNVGELAPNAFSYKCNVVHNGHSIKVDGSQEFFSKNRVWYKLLQFHFHTPSEHTIDGKYFDAEIHFVHQSATGEYLVIGVMVTGGESTPEFLREVMEKMPEEEDLEGSEVTVNHAQLLEAILGDEASAPFYTYPGSFTTPPCTERVTWIVLQNGIEISLEHITKMKSAQGANVRPVQPVNDRVLLFKPAAAAPAAAPAA